MQSGKFSVSDNRLCKPIFKISSLVNVTFDLIVPLTGGLWLVRRSGVNLRAFFNLARLPFFLGASFILIYLLNLTASSV